jgi:PilZ domain-containing protein
VLNERRKIARRVINRVAQFQTDDGSLPRSCMITDISEGGARLYSETDMPQKFTLAVSSDGGDSRRECRVVWRLGRELGVEFVDRVGG